MSIYEKTMRLFDKIKKALGVTGPGPRGPRPWSVDGETVTLVLDRRTAENAYYALALALGGRPGPVDEWTGKKTGKTHKGNGKTKTVPRGMPFEMKININSEVSPATVKFPVSFDPSPLEVMAGDLIYWANNDSKPHWPGLLKQDGSIDDTFFLLNKIAGASTSPVFSWHVAETLVYVCSIHREPPCSAAGTIEVT